MTDWSFGLLGPLEVRHRDTPCDVPRGRQQTLLATLLLRANEIVPAQTLLDQVWGAGADRSVLNVCVMRLRRSLGDSARSVLRADGDGYRIAIEPADVDLHRFRDLCRRAGRTDDRAVERTCLYDALALWRGDALTGIDSATIQSEVVPVLEEERLNALENRVAADLDAGQHSTLVPELRELVRSNPFRERFSYQLILAMYRSGRQTEALETFREVRDSFTREVGVEPGPELRELQKRILDDDSTLLVSTPEDGKARSTGGQGYVPLVPAELPRSSGFSGRRAELRRLDALLEADTPPIALITGAPGVGKTALAVQWSSGLEERCTDGQLYVDLRGHAQGSPMRPLEALAQFLRTTGLPADRIPTDPSTAASLYRSVTTGKRMLVLLDNAASVEQVRPLLPGDRGCVVVVTSRNRLTGLVAREGAAELVVDTLADDDARALLGAAIGEQRLADETGAARLIEACGNLPLALRIAAANISSGAAGSVSDYLARLHRDDRLDALTVTGDEQSAVRPAFEFSYAALTPAARRMFTLLGLFPGPAIDAQAAAALADCGRAEARDALTGLGAAHLAVERPDGRLMLHDLLRLYATELAHAELGDAEREQAVCRLYDHYAHAVHAATGRLYPQAVRLPPVEQTRAEPVEFSDDAEASGWLDAERMNLVAVVAAAATLGAPLDGCRIGAALRGFLLTKGNPVDWLTVARAGLAAARTAGDLRAEAAARISLADLHRFKGELRTAGRHYERVLILSRVGDWPEGRAAAHNNLANTRYSEGRLDEASHHLSHALRLNARVGRTAAQAANLGNLARIQLQLGRVSDSVENVRESVVLHRRNGSRQGEAQSLTTLGEAHLALGEYHLAEETLGRARSILQDLGDRAHLPHTLGDLAEVFRLAGDHARAAEVATQAAELAREAVNGWDAEAAAVRVLGSVDRAAGRHDEAIGRYLRALDLSRRSGGLEYTYAVTLVDLAATYLDIGDVERARPMAERAAAISRRVGFDPLLSQATDLLGKC